MRKPAEKIIAHLDPDPCDLIPDYQKIRTKLLEEASRIKDLKQIKKHLALLPDFLERVTLVYN